MLTCSRARGSRRPSSASSALGVGCGVTSARSSAAPRQQVWERATHLEVVHDSIGHAAPAERRHLPELGVGELEPAELVAVPVRAEVVERAAVVRDGREVGVLDGEVAQDVLRACERRVGVSVARCGSGRKGRRTGERTSGNANGCAPSEPVRASSAACRAAAYSSATRMATFATVPFLRRSASATTARSALHDLHGEGGRGRTHDGLLPGDLLRLGEAHVAQRRQVGHREICWCGPAVQRGRQARDERDEVCEDAGGILRARVERCQPGRERGARGRAGRTWYDAIAALIPCSSLRRRSVPRTAWSAARLYRTAQRSYSRLSRARGGARAGKAPVAPAEGSEVGAVKSGYHGKLTEVCEVRCWSAREFMRADGREGSAPRRAAW